MTDRVGKIGREVEAFTTQMAQFDFFHRLQCLLMFVALHPPSAWMGYVLQ
jgi:hypothetical protein